MLKFVAIQNFIHFKNLETTTFVEGANFIIGQNGSGKSGFYELIRRCMYKGINQSWSSVPDKSELAMVLCRFDLGNQPYHGNQKGLQKEDHVLYTGLFYHPNKQSKECHIYKICQVYAKEKYDKPIKLCIDTYSVSAEEFEKMNGQEKGIFKKLERKKEKSFDYDSCENPFNIHSLLNSEDSNTKELSASICNVIDDKLKDVAIKLQTSKVEHYSELSPSKDERSSREGELQKDTEDSMLEQILKFVTENYYIQTFGYRGLVSIHWTRSLLMDPNKRESNYAHSIESAEILRSLLGSDSVNAVHAKKYLDLLTYPREFTFTKNEAIEVHEGDYKSDLLKVPSGVFEAEQLSLLLACKDLRTLCLEEPDRTMHPPMVERMREFLMELPEDEKKKVIIISSHNQMMVNKKTVCRTHVFRTSGSTCSIRRLPGIPTSFPEAILRLPFSDYVLLVEGVYDQVFVKQLFAEVKKHEHSLGTAAEERETSEVEKDPKFYQFIRCLQVAAMGGKESVGKVKKFLRDIGMERRTFYLFDKDMFFKSAKTNLDHRRITTRNEFCRYAQSGKFDKDGVLFDDNKFAQFKYIESVEPTLEEETAPRSEEETRFRSEEEMAPELERKNIFSWKHGTIEDMIRASIVESVKENTFNSILDDNEECAGGKMDDNVKKIMAKKLSSVDDMDVLARFVYESEEGKRFLKFIQKMMHKSSFH